MTPRQETIFKWSRYALATLLFCVLQGLVFQRLQLWGVFPFVYPVLAAVLASLEGPLNGTVYALVLGILCDLTVPSPIPCFYTLVFPLAALCAAFLSQGVLSSGFLSALLTSAAAFLLTDGAHMLLLAARGKAAWSAAASTCGRELLLSLPLVLPVYFLFRAICRKCREND